MADKTNIWTSEVSVTDATLVYVAVFVVAIVVIISVVVIIVAWRRK